MQKFHSLPKKEKPSVNNSTYCKTIVSIKDIKTQNCPQVTEFKPSKSTQKIYIHNMEIDYGKLNKPNHYFFDGPQYVKLKKMTIENQDPLFLENISTKRLKGISNLLNSNKSQKNTQKKSNTNFNFQINNQSNKKKYFKLERVDAYQQISSRRQSSRRRQYTKIIKMIVAGGTQTTRVFSYPDNSDYLRMCRLK